MASSNNKNGAITWIGKELPPPTKEEEAYVKESIIKQRNEWFKNKLPVLLEVAATDAKLAKLLCRTVVAHFGSDPVLGPMMKKGIGVERKGNKKGAKPLDRLSKLVLLHEYAAMVPTNGRGDTLKWLADKHVVTVKAIEKRITNARLSFEPSELPDWVVQIHYPPHQ